MMLAYRRGLLEPDYKHGVQSIVRERMILTMLDKEQAAEAIKLAAMFRCMALAPALKPEAAPSFSEKLKESALRVVYLSEYSDCSELNNQPEQLEDRKGAINLSKAFIMLKERGIIEEFRRKAAEAFRNTEEDIND